MEQKWSFSGMTKRLLQICWKKNTEKNWRQQSICNNTPDRLHYFNTDIKYVDKYKQVNLFEWYLNVIINIDFLKSIFPLIVSSCFIHICWEHNVKLNFNFDE